MTPQNKHEKNSFLDSIINLVFPDRCRQCMAFLQYGVERGLCTDCLSRVQFLTEPLCSLCGKELPSSAQRGHQCGQCLIHPPSFAMARSLVRYESPVSDLLRRLKYLGDTSVAPALAELSATVARYFSESYTYIAPVPLYRTRLQERGLNQSLVLARALFPQQRNIIQPDLLIRTRSTMAQTGLDGKARRKNLKKAFTVNTRYCVQGATVLLVDDVYTTGSTVEECSATLRLFGAESVHVCTLARVSLERKKEENANSKRIDLFSRG